MIMLLQISTSDGLPSKICVSCIAQITQAYNFKNQAETSDGILKQYFNSHNKKDNSLCESEAGI